MYPAGLPSYLEEVKEAASKNYEGFWNFRESDICLENPNTS